MTNNQIKELALANGFKLKEQSDGTMDLNPYVYEFAHALMKHQTVRVYTDITYEFNKRLKVFTGSDEQYAIRKEERAFKELEQKLEREQAKKELEFQEKVFADCDKWDNRELGADEAYAKKADMRYGAMVWSGE